MYQTPQTGLSSGFSSQISRGAFLSTTLRTLKPCEYFLWASSGPALMCPCVSCAGPPELDTELQVGFMRVSWAHSPSLSMSLGMSSLSSHTSRATQLYIICEFAEGTLDPIINDTLMKVWNTFGPSTDLDGKKFVSRYQLNIEALMVTLWARLSSQLLYLFLLFGGCCFSYYHYYFIVLIILFPLFFFSFRMVSSYLENKWRVLFIKSAGTKQVLYLSIGKNPCFQKLQNIIFL